MTVFLKMIQLFLIRDENDEYAPQAMKFFGIFVASFGEELDQDGGTHAIVQHTFKYILSVSCDRAFSNCLTFVLILDNVKAILHSLTHLPPGHEYHVVIFNESRNRRGDHGLDH